MQLRIDLRLTGEEDEPIVLPDGIEVRLHGNERFTLTIVPDEQTSLSFVLAYFLSIGATQLQKLTFDEIRDVDAAIASGSGKIDEIVLELSCEAAPFHKPLDAATEIVRRSRSGGN
jgi:hypothetical protein